MVQSLNLGETLSTGAGPERIRRLNRMPIVIAIALLVLFFGVIIYGLTSRGLVFGGAPDMSTTGGPPASTFADQLKRGVDDGIIGEPALPTVIAVPRAEPQEPAQNPFKPSPLKVEEKPKPELEADAVWRARLEREQEEQFLREQQRQRMARLQAANVALDSPLVVSLDKVKAEPVPASASTTDGRGQRPGPGATDLYSAALKAGLGGQNVDPNGQTNKESFFNADLAELGYLPNRIVPQHSPFELKRGSVIPATLITGVNSDLPGRISAQVSQNVFDSATGYRLLIPQGTKLFGRYDSKVAFGQNRVLVVWTDIIFPNGSTLQIGGMAGTDAEGYGGFKDKVDNHYFRTFGSAILLAVIGTGMDMAIPEGSAMGSQDSGADAARRNFAETFGRVAERTISKNLDVQPTLKVRPGYRFNVLVDQDIVFPGAYSER